MNPAWRQALRWIRSALVENVVWKVLSLLVATVLWALVASEPELSSFANVRLQFKNLPEDLEISSEPVDTVSLELRGPSGELRDASMPAAVIIDMSGVQPGFRTFAIGQDNVNLARGLRLMRAIPSEVRFRFERRSIRNVTVVPTFSGEEQQGYSVAHWEVEPRQLTLIGPASHVARIGSVATDPIDVSGVVGSAEFRLNAFVEDPYVRFQSSPQVKVGVTMKKQ
jgi:YbbR domain-containing protein